MTTPEHRSRGFRTDKAGKLVPVSSKYAEVYDRNVQGSIHSQACVKFNDGEHLVIKRKESQTSYCRRKYQEQISSTFNPEEDVATGKAQKDH